MIPFPNMQIEKPVLGPLCVWNGSNFQGAPFFSVATSLPTPLTYFLGENSFSPPFLPQPGAVLGTVGKSSGKHYFEVALTAMFWIPGLDSAPLTNFISAVGISQAINTVSPYRFGGAGKGCVYDNLGTLTDADTFGTIPNFGPGYNLLPPTSGPNAGSPVFQNIGWAVDFGALKVWPRGPDGTFYGGNPATGAGGQSIAAGTYYPCLSVESATGVSWGGIAIGYFNNGQFSLGPVPGGFSQWR